MFPFYGTDIAGMQLAQIVHGVVAVLFVAAMLGHIYIGTIGMEGAFEAMGTAPSTSTGRRSTTACGSSRKPPRGTSPRRRRQERCSRRSRRSSTHAEVERATATAPGARVRARLAIVLAMRIIGLAGWSGSGKTTLLTKVIPRLVARGLAVSTLKHAHHAFDIDQPGKDSHTPPHGRRDRGAGRLGQPLGAGARVARRAASPRWRRCCRKLARSIWSGRRLQARAASQARGLPRRASASRCCIPTIRAIVAVASDEPLPQAEVPVVDLDDVERIADILIRHAAPLDAVLARAGARP